MRRGLLGMIAVCFIICGQAIDSKELKVTVTAYAPRGIVTLSAGAELVEVGVVVRDRDGKPVAGLSRDEFEVLDEGKRVEVSAFSVVERKPRQTATAAGEVSDLHSSEPPPSSPRYVALIVDDLNSEFREFGRAQSAARQFVQQGLGPGDQVAIFSTYGAQLLPFTSDVGEMVKAVDDLHVRNRPFESGNCPQLIPYEAYLIAAGLNDDVLIAKVSEMTECDPAARELRSGPGRQAPPRNAILGSDAAHRLRLRSNALWVGLRENARAALDSVKAVMESLGTLTGTRVVVLASGGFLTGELQHDQEAVVNQALRSGVVINSLDAKGLYVTNEEVTPGGNAMSITQRQLLGAEPQWASNAAMAYLAQATGGRFFENNNDLARGFRELGSAPEVSYLLGFAPRAEKDDAVHKLSVRVKAGEVSVQARPSYFAPRPAGKEKEALPVRPIDAAVMGTEVLTGVPARVISSTKPGENGTMLVTVVFDLRLRGLPFTERRGVRYQKLTMIAALIDDRGKVITGSEGAYELALKNETYQRLAREGFVVALQLQARPGRYRLRGVIEESSEGRITSASRALVVE